MYAVTVKMFENETFFLWTGVTMVFFHSDFIFFANYRQGQKKLRQAQVSRQAFYHFISKDILFKITLKTD